MKKSWRRHGITPNRSSERGNPAWRDWCRAVTDQVRFRPDRTAIEQELLAHLEDGAVDFERIGYDTAEAEKRALDAMGSAFLVGCALDRAHHPFLGWLWQATRVVAAGPGADGGGDAVLRGWFPQCGADDPG